MIVVEEWIVICLISNYSCIILHSQLLQNRVILDNGCLPFILQNYIGSNWAFRKTSSGCWPIFFPWFGCSLRVFESVHHRGIDNDLLWVRSLSIVCSRHYWDLRRVKSWDILLIYESPTVFFNCFSFGTINIHHIRSINIIWINSCCDPVFSWFWPTLLRLMRFNCLSDILILSYSLLHTSPGIS